MLLTGCIVRIDDSPAEIMDQAAKAETTAGETETAAVLEADIWNKDEIVGFLEQFDKDREFSDMETSEAERYGGQLKESYDFVGRKTEDGTGYVLGFKKGDGSLLDGLSISSVYDERDYIEAAVWSEQDEEYKPVYIFDNISELIQGQIEGGINEILYLQPSDMETPEEIQSAFKYRHCDGEEGYIYAEDVLRRGVRFTPPDTGAYLAVDKYENGRERWEYIPLSEEEEQEILGSDEMIAPELYGHYGMEFFVSQQVYEEKEIEQGPITMPAFKIAEERCGFKLGDIAEIHDIVKAEMELCAWDEETEEMRTVTEALEDLEQIKELEEILASSEADAEGKCPYKAILTLTREDGETVVVSLAADSCDGFILGSHGVYSPGKKATERIWELFPEIRERTGWRLAEEELAGNTEGPSGKMNTESGK